MSRLEYLLSSALLRLLGLVCSLFPVVNERIVLATARTSRLEGNLAHLHRTLQARHPDLEYVTLLEPYGYGLLSKIGYLVRVARGAFYLRTSRLFIVDNAYLPIHVAAHRSETTVVQVWHAVGALKRFGVDIASPPSEPERTFLHRYYDYVVVSSEAVRAACSRALRTPIERVLALGTPRTDFFFDHTAMRAARERLLEAYPALAGRLVVLYAPTFRGRGRAKRGGADLDAMRLRTALPSEYVLVLKTHPNLDPRATETAGYDVVVDPAYELNDLLVATDVLVSDYSSSIFEYALLRRPLVLLVGDLAEYERDPGLYLEYSSEMIGTHVVDTDGVAEAILHGRFDLSGYDAFIERYLGACDGHASERFVERFVGRSAT